MGAAAAAAGGVLLTACHWGGAPVSGRGETPLVFGSDGSIALLSLDGRQRKPLTPVTRGAFARDPMWSPDGQRIAYSYSPPALSTRGPGGMLPLPVTDVYVMNADGSGAKVLLPHDAPGIGYETPVWAPDGQSLFVTYTELVVESNVVKDQIIELARLSVGGGTRRTLVRNGTSPTISQDGKRLAYIDAQLEGQALVVADVDGKHVKTLVPTRSMDGLAAPRFSPDGRQIVFRAVAPMPPIPTPTPPPVRRAQAHGLPMDVFVVDVEGASPRRLTKLGEDSPAAVWSPDGKRIVILAGGGLYIMNADGSNLTSIDQKGGHGSIDWKPR